MSNRPRLSDVLYADILAQIGENALAADARLPTEKELATQFGVSRPIVREALRRLREEGWIYSRQGAGSFVAGAARSVPPREPRASLHASAAAPTSGVTSIAEVRRIFEYRIALEGGAAFAAASNRNEEELEAIRIAMEASEATLAIGEPGVQQDADFHHAIIRATQNHLFEKAFTDLRSQLYFVIELSRTVSALRSPEHMALVQRQHRAIYECLRQGNPAGARDATQTHIRTAQEHIFSGILI